MAARSVDAEHLIRRSVHGKYPVGQSCLVNESNWSCGPGDERRRADAPVRVGDTLRRSTGANSEFLDRLLVYLDQCGVSWSPRALGVDESGRQVFSWIDGEVPSRGEEIELDALARLVREFHDLTTGFVDDAECVIHDDLQPRNVVVIDRHPIGLIDWEQARPGSRIEDVANLCWSFVEPTPASDPVWVAQQWKHILDAYRFEDRQLLLPTMVTRMARCVADIERNAAAGSPRHRILAGRGDHENIRAMHSWTIAHQRDLARIVTTQ